MGKLERVFLTILIIGTSIAIAVLIYLLFNFVMILQSLGC